MEKINEESQEIDEQQKQPLLENQNQEENPTKQQKTKTQKAIRKTFKRTSHLQSLLPSGSVLIFEMLSPIMSKQGQCQTFLTQFSVICLIIFIGITCFLANFIDSVKDEKDKIRYGFATFKGIWIIDGSMSVDPNEATKYRIRVVDFVHAIMGIIVFMAVVLLDQNVVTCLFPTPSQKTKDKLVMFPIVVGVVCGLLFVWFPTNRNGVATPLSKKK
ncbi:protein DMP7-like [Amaranthus tricolor]|uniref:protein DMP7-like n=1 Tax=Amaranthus tricolor TaxID=29722 RepID=UPI0025864C81|nr:protein DMP7-like [Amaranthus tricolor]